ncbi:hypothetical protein C731_0926 [Mycolicibacterium hassiacum DSM 44199]|uniref:Uncharacterized protein n=1 Tax=Mycolicibacterium hassiacum (strain DSM 44199 / CIP 105218 / JCM 12690 / 3849) TaxID=1122247 RepID=K5BCA4_MYCHD|nr:hypothetical protein C731_0926 [Mycolicibacterium hassiacum DSM 44199]
MGVAVDLHHRVGVGRGRRRDLLRDGRCLGTASARCDGGLPSLNTVERP